MGDISKERPQKIYRTHLLTTYCCCSDKRLEPSIAAARASVMVYDDINKKWIPAGASHGLSKVSPSLFNNLTNSERGLRHNPKFLLKCSVADLGFFIPDPDPGSKRFRIPDPDLHQRIEVFLTLKTVSNLSENLSGIYIPDPDFFHL